MKVRSKARCPARGILAAVLARRRRSSCSTGCEGGTRSRIALDTQGRARLPLGAARATLNAGAGSGRCCSCHDERCFQRRPCSRVARHRREVATSHSRTNSSRHKLAEETRRSAAAREHASQLERRVQALAEELERAARIRTRPLASLARSARTRDEGRADRYDGAALRRIGHGQGSRRAFHPSRIDASQGPVRRAQLRSAAGTTAGIGTVRPRPRRVHRRAGRASGQARTGRGRRAVPRRSRAR